MPVLFALHFHGEAVELDPGRFWVETRARFDEFDGIGDGEALCRRDFELTDDGSLLERGEMSFGGGHAITFSARGRLRASPDPRYRHGTAVLEVTGGRGKLAGARGFVTSNFLLSDAGELTDHHQGLIFLATCKE
ncbi:MAG TPA: hypothetical protein VGU71_13380 [Candidatus Dormibacteraeota bacterium]|nr:hypothetical protein [Candidatus Dormibacteraeota bacterium]